MIDFLTELDTDILLAINGFRLKALDQFMFLLSSKLVLGASVCGCPCPCYKALWLAFRVVDSCRCRFGRVFGRPGLQFANTSFG